MSGRGVPAPGAALSEDAWNRAKGGAGWRASRQAPGATLTEDTRPQPSGAALGALAALAADAWANASGRRSGWWERYNAYLASPAWQEKRRRVLQRARGVCEGCAEARATQVHHLTYKRVGNELLFDLVAVCRPCHQRAHPNKELRGDD